MYWSHFGCLYLPRPLLWQKGEQDYLVDRYLDHFSNPPASLRTFARYPRNALVLHGYVHLVIVSFGASVGQVRETRIQLYALRSWSMDSLGRT